MTTPKDFKAEQASVPVNVDELRKSKDLIIRRLMDLQSHVAELSKAYLEHANNVINGGPATIEMPPMLAGAGALRTGSLEPGDKKRKRRAPPDPNAPKRALTPYFLFMQHNRQKIAKDLGGGAKPKEVADEGTRRWQVMSSLEKEIWKKLYAENYEKYKRDMEAYKAGKSTGGEEHDAASNQLQNDIASADNGASDDDTSSEEEEEEEDESSDESPAPKEPTPPRSSNKRRKKEKIESPKKASPQKKGKAAKEPVSVQKEEPKSSRKKRKSEGAK